MKSVPSVAKIPDSLFPAVLMRGRRSACGCWRTCASFWTAAVLCRFRTPHSAVPHSAIRNGRFRVPSVANSGCDGKSSFDSVESVLMRGRRSACGQESRPSCHQPVTHRPPANVGFFLAEKTGVPPTYSPRRRRYKYPCTGVSVLPMNAFIQSKRTTGTQDISGESSSLGAPANGTPRMCPRC